MIVAVVVITGLFLWYFYHATGQFIRAYESYATLSLSEENAAYAPGQPDNPVRREMNQMLAEVLGVKMTTADRFQKARRGFELVQESEHLLDPIQDRGGEVDQAIAGMRARTNALTDMSSFGREKKLIELAKRRAESVLRV